MQILGCLIRFSRHESHIAARIKANSLRQWQIVNFAGKMRTGVCGITLFAYLYPISWCVKMELIGVRWNCDWHEQERNDSCARHFYDPIIMLHNNYTDIDWIVSSNFECVAFPFLCSFQFAQSTESGNIRNTDRAHKHTHTHRWVIRSFDLLVSKAILKLRHCVICRLAAHHNLAYVCNKNWAIRNCEAAATKRKTVQTALNAANINGIDTSHARTTRKAPNWPKNVRRRSDDNGKWQKCQSINQVRIQWSAHDMADRSMAKCWG